MTIQFDPPPMRLVNDSPFQAWQRRQTNFQNLATAVQTGNLAAARNAIASINLDAPPAPKHGPGATQTDQFHSDLNTLFDAVKAGDLTAAQQALATLQRDLPIGYGPQVGSMTISTWSITIQFGTTGTNGDTTASATTTTATSSSSQTGAATNAADPDHDGDTAATSANPLQQLIAAVKAGDLTAAQQALQLLQNATGRANGHHHHHHHHHDRQAESSSGASNGGGIRKSPATPDGGPSTEAHHHGRDGGVSVAVDTPTTIELPVSTQ